MTAATRNCERATAWHGVPAQWPEIKALSRVACVANAHRGSPADSSGLLACVERAGISPLKQLLKQPW
jgi:hypothetical protein